MIRGLNKNWKQSFAYYVGNPNGHELHQILERAIKELQNIGFNIVALSCDQGSSNRSAYSKFKVTVDKPFIFANESKIYLLYDTPHLVKSVRNALLSHDILVTDNKTVSWRILRKLLLMENGVVRSLYHLTEAHIQPNAFQRQNVSLATQIFSAKTVACIQTALALNCFENEDIQIGEATSELVKNINDLFDILNSITKYSANPHRCAISDEKFTLIERLGEIKNYIETWKRPEICTTTDGIKKRKLPEPYCFKGNVLSIVSLYNRLKQISQPIQRKTIYWPYTNGVSRWFSLDNLLIFAQFSSHFKRKKAKIIWKHNWCKSSRFRLDWRLKNSLV